MLVGSCCVWWFSSPLSLSHSLSALSALSALSLLSLVTNCGHLCLLMTIVLPTNEPPPAPPPRNGGTPESIVWTPHQFGCLGDSDSGHFVLFEGRF